MTENRAFQILTAVPVVAPLVAFGIMKMTPNDPRITTTWEMIVDGLVFFGLYGSIPYLLFLIVLYAFIRPKSRTTWYKALLIGPLAIAICVGLVPLIRGLVIGRLGDGWEGGMFVGILACYAGYAYAITIFVLMQLLRLTGVVRSPRDLSV
jgi:hypothetical protein